MNKRICPICGSEFIPTTYNNKYCSRECAKTAKSEYRKQWYLNNRERCSEQRKEYYKQHREEQIENTKKYYQKHREKIREYRKKYYLEHKAELNKYSRNYQKNKRADKCAMEHDNCFSCPTKDGNCLYE